MSLIELFLLAAGLSMDAFAVSVCKGLSMQKMRAKHALIIGLYFGGFQALMPWIGYTLGIRFQGAIKAYDHWIAFILLGIIGFNMVKESMDNETESCDASIDVKTMLILAIATSIDALAVGVTFAFLDVRILQAGIGDRGGKGRAVGAVQHQLRLSGFGIPGKRADAGGADIDSECVGHLFPPMPDVDAGSSRRMISSCTSGERSRKLTNVP